MIFRYLDPLVLVKACVESIASPKVMMSSREISCPTKSGHALPGLGILVRDSIACRATWDQT